VEDLVVTHEDAVDTVYDLLYNYNWATSYTAKPQIIKERDKAPSDRAGYIQRPTDGWIHISEVSYNRKRADAQFHSEDVSQVISLKMTANSRSRLEEIWSGVEAIRRTYRCQATPSSGTTFDSWEFLRQTKLMEYMDSSSIIVDYELKIYKQSVTSV